MCALELRTREASITTTSDVNEHDISIIKEEEEELATSERLSTDSMDQVL